MFRWKDLIENKCKFKYSYLDSFDGDDPPDESDFENQTPPKDTPPPSFPEDLSSTKSLITVSNPASSSVAIPSITAQSPIMSKQAINDLSKLLYKSCENGELNKIKSLFAQGARLDHIDADGTTVLHLAVKKQSKDIMEWLLKTLDIATAQRLFTQGAKVLVPTTYPSIGGKQAGGMVSKIFTPIELAVKMLKESPSPPVYTNVRGRMPSANTMNADAAFYDKCRKERKDIWDILEKFKKKKCDCFNFIYPGCY